MPNKTTFVVAGNFRSLVIAPLENALRKTAPISYFSSTFDVERGTGQVFATIEKEVDEKTAQRLLKALRKVPGVTRVQRHAEEYRV